MTRNQPILDHGYVRLVEFWGSDEQVIEAARMSTSKGFQGWGPMHGPECPRRQNLGAGLTCDCTTPGDEKLLKYLWDHKHATPFEMAGMIIEVQAPIFVFREWRTHRTASQFDDIEFELWHSAYSEMSARYTPLPDVNYRPTRERILEGASKTGNRQAMGLVPLVAAAVDDWLQALDAAYAGVEQTFQTGLALGIPKEIARVILPVGRYSRMRASANLRNWLAFLSLRLPSNAQEEIRVYATAVAELIAECFPRTYQLFDEGRRGE